MVKNKIKFETNSKHRFFHMRIAKMNKYIKTTLIFDFECHHHKGISYSLAFAEYCRSGGSPIVEFRHRRHPFSNFYTKKQTLRLTRRVERERSECVCVCCYIAPRSRCA